MCHQSVTVICLVIVNFLCHHSWDDFTILMNEWHIMCHTTLFGIQILYLKFVNILTLNYYRYETFCRQISHPWFSFLIFLQLLIIHSWIRSPIPAPLDPLQLACRSCQLIHNQDMVRVLSLSLSPLACRLWSTISYCEDKRNWVISFLFIFA